MNRDRDEWYAGDEACADLPEGTFEGVILGFNPSGLSALIRLSAAPSGYREGSEVPIPVRFLYLTRANRNTPRQQGGRR